MVSLLQSAPGNVLRRDIHHALDRGHNGVEVYMVDIFDKSKHASVGDPPAAGDGSRYEGFHQPKEWSEFKVNHCHKNIYTAQFNFEKKVPKNVK